MPKIKTKKGAAKRFKITATGKIMRNRAYHSHLLGKKTRKRKRNLRKRVVVTGVDAARIRRMVVA